MTNYEKIKAMPVEEMADFMLQRFDCAVCPKRVGRRNQTLIDCLDGLEEWLLNEVEE